MIAAGGAVTPRRARLGVALAVAAWLASPVAAQRGAADPPPPVADPGGDSLRALVRPLFATVEALRGHAFRTPVPVTLVSDSVAGVYRERMAREMPPALLHAETVAYERLGLLPQDTDVEALLLSLLEEQAGGYYAPERKAFYVLADMPRSVLPIIAVHELTHALDDQYFAIDSILARQEDDSDRLAAVGGVVEGSGTLVMAVYAARELQSGRFGLAALQEFAHTDAVRADKFMQAPAAIRRGLLATYLLGSSFLMRGDMARVAGGVVPADLDRAFREPPESTEQLLHPAKYWDPAQHDAPRAVPAPDVAALLGRGWSRIGSDTLGELLLALLVGAVDPDITGAAGQRPEDWTLPAASGWGGDRWTAYAHGDSTALVLVTRWDSEPDAVEFETAVKLPAGGAKARRGDAVVLVAGLPPARVASVTDACFAALATGVEPGGKQR